jgi:hypothetical protein
MFTKPLFVTIVQRNALVFTFGNDGARANCVLSCAFLGRRKNECFGGTSQQRQLLLPAICRAIVPQHDLQYRRYNITKSESKQQPQPQQQQEEEEEPLSDKIGGRGRPGIAVESDGAMRTTAPRRGSARLVGATGVTAAGSRRRRRCFA